MQEAEEVELDLQEEVLAAQAAVEMEDKNQLHSKELMDLAAAVVEVIQIQVDLLAAQE